MIKEEQTYMKIRRKCCSQKGRQKSLKGPNTNQFQLHGGNSDPRHWHACFRLYWSVCLNTWVTPWRAYLPLNIPASVRLWECRHFNTWSQSPWSHWKPKCLESGFFSYYPRMGVTMNLLHSPSKKKLKKDRILPDPSLSCVPGRSGSLGPLPVLGRFWIRCKIRTPPVTSKKEQMWMTVTWKSIF